MIGMYNKENSECRTRQPSKAPFSNSSLYEKTNDYNIYSIIRKRVVCFRYVDIFNSVRVVDKPEVGQ